MATPRKDPKDKKKAGRKKKDLSVRLAERKLDYDLIRRMAEEGNSDAQIARILGVRALTIFDWKRENQEFDDILKTGKEVADGKVQTELFRGAVGFEFEEVTTEVADIIDQQGKATGLRTRKVKRVKRYYPGDATKQIFWLKNRQPEHWKDRHDVGFDPNKPVKLVVEYADAPSGRKS